jgi:plasmid maintenance system antidote protein VapI
MHNKVLIYLLKRLGLKQSDLAKMCQTQRKTVNCWVKGHTRTPAIVLLHLKLLLDIKTFSDDLIKFKEVKDAS